MASLSKDQVRALMATPGDLDADIFSDLIKCLKDNDDELVLDALRVLRNCCAVNHSVKSAIAEKHPEFVDTAGDLLARFLSSENYLATGIVCQLLYNYGADAQDVSMKKVRDAIAKNHFEALRASLGVEHFKTRNYSASVFFSLLSKGDVINLIRPQIGPDVLTDLCQNIRDDSEWSLFCIKALAESSPEIMAEHFTSLSLVDRSTVIDVYAESLSLVVGNRVLINHLKDHFKQQSAQILTTLKNKTGAQTNLEPAEFIKIVSLFCELSALDESCPNTTDETKLLIKTTRQLIQDDKSLLIDTVYLLRMIHDLGKSSDRNLFTPVRKMSEESSEDTVENPAFGFKRDLIRLVGNLSWKHKENQDEVKPWTFSCLQTL